MYFFFFALDYSLPGSFFQVTCHVIIGVTASTTDSISIFECLFSVAKIYSAEDTDVNWLSVL